MELTLALAILAIGVSVAFESMINLRSYGGLQARQGDLEEQSRRVARFLQHDLANTAWYIGYNKKEKREERLFPQVIRGTQGTYGDEIVYLRLRTERTIGTTPQDGRVARVDFLHEPPVPMDRFARANGVRSLLLNPDWTPETKGSSQFAIPAWETTTPGVGFAEAQDVSRLRFYRLVVRPDLTVTGRGVLFREYRDGDRGQWVSDERIADNIVTFMVATNREIPALNANQVQVDVSFQADDLETGQARAQRTLQLVIAMRSSSTE